MAKQLHRPERRQQLGGLHDRPQRVRHPRLFVKECTQPSHWRGRNVEELPFKSGAIGPAEQLQARCPDLDERVDEIDRNGQRVRFDPVVKQLAGREP